MTKNRWSCGNLLWGLLFLPLLAMASPVVISNSALADAHLAHAQAIRRVNAKIISLLNRGAYREALPLLQQAAQDKEDFWAAATLGHLYQAGLGVKADPTQAFHWYQQAAETGDRFAQRQVANAYLNGWGVQRNPQRAAFWFRQGMMVPQVVNADYWLSKSYAAGRIMPKNPAKADWYQGRSLRLLDQLYAEKVGAAAYDLGIAYLYGHGVPKNPERAKNYFQHALAWHYSAAATVLARLEEKKS